MGFLPALLYALLMGAVPIVEVVASGRPPAALLLLFWFETVLLVFTNAIRIVVHRRATGAAGHHATIGAIGDRRSGVEQTRRGLGAADAYLRSYLGINLLFTLAHGVFVLLLVFVVDFAGRLAWSDARLALLYAAGVQGVFLAWDLRRLPGWRFRDLSTSVGNAGVRVLVTQLGLILGLPVAAATGSPWGLVATFVGLRALADASIAWLTGLLKQRDLPPGFAAILSARSGQSVASLEAEFDALKADGAAVEDLLDRPVGEVRRDLAPDRRS